mmetsp:Transcript_10886/g.15567  ORF Transcript_10886/g.15567 Transcript_10886/m.15567 type:complete len:96 (+) Transcript_10886:540-827(+)
MERRNGDAQNHFFVSSSSSTSTSSPAEPVSKQLHPVQCITGCDKFGVRHSHNSWTPDRPIKTDNLQALTGSSRDIVFPEPNGLITTGRKKPAVLH